MSPIHVFFVFLVFAIDTQFTVCGLPTIIKRSPQQDFDLEDEYKEPTDCLRNTQEFEAVLKDIFSSADSK